MTLEGKKTETRLFSKAFYCFSPNGLNNSNNTVSGMHNSIKDHMAFNLPFLLEAAKCEDFTISKGEVVMNIIT